MSKNHVLENSKVRFDFSSQGNLKAITDLVSNYQTKCAGNSSLWGLSFRDKNGQLKKVLTENSELVEIKKANNKIIIKWDIKNLNSKVTATISLDDEESIADWYINVANKSGMSLWEVQYPIFGGFKAFDKKGENDKLAIPWGFGFLFDDPVKFITKEGGARTVDWMSEFAQCDTGDEKVNKVAYSYPGMWSMQFLSFYNPDKGGIYFGAHDGKARFKSFGLYQHSRDSVAFIMTNYPDERMTKNLNYTTPYPIKAGVFQGEWHDAAKIYRQWAVKQKWCSKGKVKDRKDLPQSLKDNDFWFWNWGSHMKDAFNAAPDLFGPITVELKKQLNLDSMWVHWYGSHSEPFNLKIPELFPIDDTKKKKLKKALDLMHKNQIYAIPYFNPRLCDPNTVTWDKYKVKNMACVDEKGKICEEEYLEGWPWITICPSQKKWHKVCFDIVKECMDHDYDGVYIDQVSACYAVPCFANKHGHPRGGGQTWYKGNHDLSKLIQNKLKTKKTCFTSESTIECYNDVFDANLARTCTRIQYHLLGSQNAWPIPLCNSIYHDYIITYGSTTILKDNPPDVIYLGGALNLLSGNQLCFEGITYGILLKNKLKDYISYYRNLCAFRKKYRKYFNFGEWAPPLDIKTRKVKLNLSEFRPEWETPVVLAGTWKLDGKQLYYFVNHTGMEQKISFKMNGKTKEMKIPARNAKGFVK